MIAVRQLSVDDWSEWREMRLEALREAPYAFGSSLAEWQGNGDTEARWRQRLTDVPFNVIAYLDRTPAGIGSGTAPSADGTVELISMWVAPFARRRGVGDTLVSAVVHWCRSLGVDRIALCVVPSNERAIAFYRRNGFEDRGVENEELRMALTLK